MPPKKDPKKDAKGGKASAKSQAPSKKSGGGGKAKKKKWSKGKVKEKLNNAVYFEKGTYDRLLKEIPKSKMITPAIVTDRLKVNVSVARRGIRELLEKGLIKTVALHARQMIFTRATSA